jgi:hypothetical protein
VRFSIFLCFFLRIRLRRFLIREPMAWVRIVGPGEALFKMARLAGRVSGHRGSRSPRKCCPAHLYDGWPAGASPGPGGVAGSVRVCRKT